MRLVTRERRLKALQQQRGNVKLFSLRIPRFLVRNRLLKDLNVILWHKGERPRLTVEHWLMARS